MRKLDLILEDIRDEYMINLLEEGETTELETLKTKKFLQENLNRIRKMLIEEGALEGVKQHLGDNWGKYLSGIGAAGAGALANQYGDVGDVVQQGQDQIAGYTGENPVSQAIGTVGGGLGRVAGNIADGVGADATAAGQAIGNAAGQAGDAIAAVPGQISDAAGNAYDQADAAVGGHLPGGVLTREQGGLAADARSQAMALAQPTGF